VAGEAASGRRRLLVPAGQRAPLPRTRGARRTDARGRVHRGRLADVRGRHSRPPRRTQGMSALATIRETPGLDVYLEELEEQLAATVRTHGGLVAAVSRDALNAGGKRLRPLLVFLATPPGETPSVAAGVAVELVHMATLVHDDLIDGAEFRRGRASAWSAYGP